MATAIVVGSLALGAIGMGMQYYSQNQQASNASALANYNYQVQAQNAQYQAAIAAQQAQTNQAIAQANINGQYAAASVHDVNARILRGQGDATITTAQEEIRRQRQDNLRNIARQRAGYAAGGVLMTGTPLAVMAETVGLQELQVQDTLYGANLERERYFQQASNERFQGELTRYGATNFQIQSNQYAFDAAAARSGQMIAMRNAEIERLSGVNQAQGYRSAARATLISGVGSTIGSAYNIYRAA